MILVFKILIELLCYAIGSGLGVLAVENWNTYQREGNRADLFFFFWDMMLVAVVTAMVIWVIFII